MNDFHLPFRLGVALAFVFWVAPHVSAEPSSCADAARKIEREAAARPERVLILVEDALVVDESCACEVVKAAIVGSKAGPKLVGQIVFTAVTAAPKSAALIAECAAAASPDASPEIKAALTKALGEGAATVVAAPLPSADSSIPAQGQTDKNPAKNPPPALSSPEPSQAPLAVGGVYLLYPAGGASAPSEAELITRTIIRRVPGKPKVIVLRQPTATSSHELPRH